MINIQSLNKYYNRGKQNEIHVIDNISLELPERGMVAIFGKSGCGKTTLLNVIGGLDKYDGGSVRIENNDIVKHTDEVRNRYIGYIFQNYNLSNDRTCFDNVADTLRLCGMKDSDELENRVKAALANVGMEKFASRTPDTLSGGQQQRIAIARAIVKNPRIILADEPTGNLDESNTLVIMELLKQIAGEHLVLLVTHEANLVDYYCDKVIELSDGKVVSVRENNATRSYAAKDKNDIYLGELNKRELKDDGVEIELYGEPATPLKLKFINSGGKLYLRIDTPKIQVLDDTSEVKLKDGVYSHDAPVQESRRVDMSLLPPVDGKRFGQLFTFKSAVKSGYAANFRKKGKKGKKVLRACMTLFAAVIVLVSSFFSMGFKQISDIDKLYNHNVFYLLVDSQDDWDQIHDAVGSSDYGIDYIRVSHRDYWMQSAGFISYRTHSFETASAGETLSTNTEYLGEELCKDLPVVIGKNSGVADDEVVITTTVADALLEESPYSYISSYGDLIGMLVGSGYFQAYKVAGIVRSGERSVYLSDLAMAKYALSYTDLLVCSASDYGYHPEKGETLYVSYSNGAVPEVGKEILIGGVPLTVTKVITNVPPDYDEWLTQNGYEITFYETINDEDYFNSLAEYLSHFEEYLSELMLTDDFDLWLATEKNSFVAYCEMINRYVYDSGRSLLGYGLGFDYYAACNYRMDSGEFPSPSELLDDPDYSVYALHEDYYNNLNKCYTFFRDEFYQSANYKGLPNGYLLNEEDYIAVSRQMGSTDVSAVSGYSFNPSELVDVKIFDSSYVVLHSKNPADTVGFLEEYFDYDEEEYVKFANNTDIITPATIRASHMSGQKYVIIYSTSALVITIVLMSLCMYFIMRSSVMTRIKEVGIYRAIGVSKKNLIFKFLVETLVLTLLTVFVGYLIMSILIFWISGNAIVSLVYYPVWLAIIVFLVLCGVCLLCGLLPVLTLLHKSPSEILAKYDI